ncbi:MAG: hypothetical protein IKP76_01155 [Bacilli bacterium]|nr:hypothetical protein [Bacilli bacterium]
MKNKLLLFITILLICIFPTYIFAEEETIKTYNNVKVSSVITTSVNMDDITKIIMKYRVYSSPDNYKDEEITLIKSDGFSTNKYHQSITDVKFLSAYAVASDGTVDKYGFITYKSNNVYDDETSSITIELQISFNDMGFDGKNYRRNSDVSDEYIEERKNGVAAKDSKVITKNATQPTTIPTTTITNERKVINDSTSNNNTKEKKEKHNEQSYKILEYIIIGAFVLVGIVCTVVLVKYNASNKRV